MSCYLGSALAAADNFGITAARRMGEIRRTSQTLVFLDEDDLSIDDGNFLYPKNAANWYNIPGWRHQNGTVLVFADAHTEYWKWKSRRPSMTSFGGGTMEDPLGHQDMDRLLQTTPDSE